MVTRDLFMETNNARLTLLIDPDKKRLFEQICSAQDLIIIPGRAAFNSGVHRSAPRFSR